MAKKKALLMDENEAAQLLNVSRSTLLRARQAGKIRFYRIGWLVQYDRAQLDEYLQTHCASVPRPNNVSSQAA